MTNEEILAHLEWLPEKFYVLHGSRNKYSTLEPFFPNQEGLREGAYNQLAVYGTLVIEIALLYAVIHEDSRDWGWKISNTSSSSEIIVKGPANIRQGRGYVHVLSRDSFPRVIPPGLVCLSSKAARVIEAFMVSPDILLPFIEKGSLRFEC